MNAKFSSPLPPKAMEPKHWFPTKFRISRLGRQAKKTAYSFFKAVRIASSSLFFLVTIYGVQAIADQSDTHYFEIRQLDGRIVSIELIRSADGRKVGIAYPYPHLIRNLHSLPVQKMTVSEFQQLASPGSAPPVLPAPTYATGMAIGYNDSTGAAPGQCYNFTSQMDATSTNTNFQVTNTISSFAQALNVSSSVQGSYDAFSATNDFSYSDSYDATSISGSTYLSASSTFTLTNAPDSASPLNQSGSSALTGGTFASVCGSSYMNTVLGGMSVVGRINWASSSTTQADKFSDTFTAGVGLDSLTTAVSGAQTVSHASFSCGFTLSITGGGDYNISIANALGANGSNLSLCCQGTTSACTTFSTNMNASITENVGAFATTISNNWPANGAADLDSLGVAAFPEGLAGISNPRRTTAASTLNIQGDTSDPWEGVTQNALQNYLTVLNQIRTLENRAKTLNTAVGGTFNPTQLLNLQSYLSALITDYGNTVGSGTNPVQNTMLSNLKTCLSDQTNSTNVGTQCEPIVQIYNEGNGITNAYDMFTKDNFTGANQWLLEQNTVALQYTGFFTNDTGSTWPEDVMYIDQLPSFVGQTNLAPIGNQAALVGFADAPFDDNGTLKSHPAVAFLPLWPNSDLQDVHSTDSQAQQGVYLTPQSMAAHRSLLPMDIPQPGLWYGIWEESAYPYSNDDMISWTSATNCSPTFENPCGIGYVIPESWEGITWGGHPLAFSMTQIPDLFDASLGSSEGPQLSSATVKGLNTFGEGTLNLAGEYQRPDGLDLSKTQLSLDLLLYERGAGGAGGLGELVVDATGKPITPISLIRRKHSANWQAVYETGPGVKPRIRIHLKSDPKSPVLRVSMDLDKGSIAVPSACQNGQETVDLGHRITLRNESANVSRSIISRQAWECVYNKGRVMELRLLQAPQNAKR